MIKMLLPSEMQAMKLGVNNPKIRVFDEPTFDINYLTSWSRIDITNIVEGHNDLVGDCVETAACNIIQTLLARQNRFLPINNNLPVEIYSAVTGFNPSNPLTDKGTDIESFFAWWKNNSISGFKLLNTSSINPKNKNLIKSTIEKNGCVMAIMALATEQQNERIWTATGNPGSWGFHCGVFDSYEADLYYLSTWGISQLIEQSYFDNNFVVECFNIELESA